MERIDFFLSLIKRMSIADLLRSKEIIVDMIKEKGEDHVFSYDKISKISQELKISEEAFEEALSTMEKLEPLLDKEGIGYLTFFSAEYPAKLRQIHQMPKILYYKGNKELLHHHRMMAIVGTRKPTPYGIWATKKLAKDLVENDFCIVSGMAAGVDGISHEEAVNENGKTLCVLGGSIDKPYPKSNIKLMKKVLDSGGLVISEYSPLDNTIPANFAYRNRIVSGLSDGVLITEAGMKSGTLITANYALEQGKTIFAVPGNINSKYSVGTNDLIKQGAVVTCSIYDILEELQIEYRQEIEHKAIPSLSETENKVYDQIKSRGICHIEQIAISTGINIKDITGILNIMEIKGLINYDGFMASVI